MKKIYVLVLIMLSTLGALAQTTPWVSTPVVTPNTRTNNGVKEIRFIQNPNFIYAIQDTINTVLRKKDTSRFVASRHYVDSLHAKQGNLSGTNTWSGPNTFTGGLTTTTDFTVTNANGHSNNNTGDKITFDMVESIGKRAGGGLQFRGDPQIFQNNSGVQMLHLETGSIYAPYFAVNSAPSNGTDVVRLQDLPGGAINNTYSKSQTDSVAKAKLLHVVIAGGQSNELGSSQQPSLATPVPSTSGFKYNNLTTSMQGAGEPYGASNGSMFNAYINTYYNATKIRPYVVMTAIGSTGMTASDGSVVGCWDTQGGCTLTTQSIARADSAIAVAVAAGYKISDVTIVFGQGETSGSSPSFNTNNYITAISRVKNAYINHYGSSITKFVVVRTGEYGSGYTPYRPVRLAQEIFADTASNTIMGYRGAVKFYQRGYMRSDSTHWTQAGQNEAGVYAARADVGGVKTPFSYEYNNGSVNNYYSAINDPMYKIGKPIPIDNYNILHVSDTTSTVGNAAINSIANEPVINLTAATTGQSRGIKNYFTYNNAGFNSTNSTAGANAFFNFGRINGSGTLSNYINNYSIVQNIGSGTVSTLINTYVENNTNAGSGFITNSKGLFIKQQSGGSNNIQLHLGNTTVTNPSGNWAAYIDSPNPVFFGSTLNQNGGIAYDWYNGTYDATNYQKVRMLLSSNTFSIAPSFAGTGTTFPNITIGNTSKVMTWNFAPGTLGSVFTLDHGLTSGSQLFTANITGNFTATGNNIYSFGVTPTLAGNSMFSWTGFLMSPLVTSVGTPKSYFIRLGTNTAAKGTGTHTDKYAIDINGGVTLGSNGPLVTYQSSTGTTNDSLRFASSQRMVQKALILQAGTGETAVQTATSLTLGNDTTIIATKANSYTLAQMQTKLGLYTAALVDNILPVTASTTITGANFATGKKTTLDIFCDATGGAVTITLPSASTFAGYIINVIKKDASANAVTINTMLGANTLTSQYQTRQIINDSTNWYNN